MAQATRAAEGNWQFPILTKSISEVHQPSAHDKICIKGFAGLNLVIASVSEAIQLKFCRNSVLDCFARARNDVKMLE